MCLLQLKLEYEMKLEKIIRKVMEKYNVDRNEAIKILMREAQHRKIEKLLEELGELN